MSIILILAFFVFIIYFIIALSQGMTTPTDDLTPTNRVYLSDVVPVLERTAVESLKNHAVCSKINFSSRNNNTEQVALTRHNGATSVEHDLPYIRIDVVNFSEHVSRFRLRRKIIYVRFRARFLYSWVDTPSGAIRVRTIEISACRDHPCAKQYIEKRSTF